jgi:hypothetical protein
MLKSWQAHAPIMTAAKRVDSFKGRIQDAQPVPVPVSALTLDGRNLSIPSPCFGQT